MKKLFATILVLALLVVALPTGAQEDTGLSIYVTEDGSYLAVLLDGWVAEGSRGDGLQIANSAELMELMDSDEDVTIPAGSYALFVFALAEADLGMEDVDAVTFTTTIVSLLSQEEDAPPFGEVAAFELSDRDAARTDATDEDGDYTLIGYQIAPETWAFGILFAAPGEGAAGEEIGLALLDAISYSLPMEETYEGEMHSFDYPAGWMADAYDEGVYLIANDQAAYEAPTMETGQFNVWLTTLPSGDLVELGTTFLAGFLEEGDELSDPVIFNAGETEVVLLDVDSETAVEEYGLLLIDGGDEVHAALYVAAAGETAFIGLTAMNMLLSFE